METTKLFFPVWMMFINPVSWAAIIPSTFLIAFFGLFISLYIVRPNDVTPGERFKAAWADAKTGMWRAWINLSAAYAFGTALMLAPAILTIGMAEASAIRQAALAIAEDIYKSALAVIWTILCFSLSAALSYLLNRTWTFKKAEIEDVKRAASWLAVLTAPWLFFSTYRLFY